ncbi:Gfo/Idh/MocA family oxidoreductase [Paenibacillus athensensis]|uniref:Oxidoreductase n=1 Tax=Paenibacillus athensensis TaxID=1967502 RepID=A0A4Y8PU64_9BACL|nr:Gfo/Idh/MocA family oxidoreductase [Paenibacillus athensensis]MCD1261765.1 Gfo/Idh/MocA family oxidoreductase [Paenibacillus athensensis]
MNIMGIGVVGCGYFGAELARAANGIAGLRVAAVYGGSRAASLAEELGCAEEQELEALVKRDDIQAVIVASPSHLHAEAALLAASYGKHVFCEKPVALTLRDCAAMTRACKDAGVLLMAGHIMHFMHGVRQAKLWIESGEIGQPLVAHAERTGWEDKQLNVSWKKNQATSGGHLFHHIHELDLLQSIMGPAVAVTAAGGNLAHQGEGYGDEDDVLLLTLEFPDGALGTMQYGSGFRWPEHYIKIGGTEGAILLDMQRAKVHLRKPGQLTTVNLHANDAEDLERASSYETMDGGIAYGTAEKRTPGWLRTVIRLELEAFGRALHGETPEPSVRALFNGSAGLSSVATAEAAMAALRTGCRIVIAEGE